MPAQRTLYLIDGYAQFFRAYHAIRTPMSSPVTKEPTNLTFGFIGMLLKLLRAEGKVGVEGAKPDYIAVTLDVSGDRGTFRSRLYPEYKATRPPPPEDLPPQVDRCLRTLRELGIPIIGAEGFEADDVIATLVTQLHGKHPDLRIRIISKDKDLKQLLAERRVELFDIHTDVVTDAAAFEAEVGIKPAQVIDMLALMGDAADNVPGVDGVGPKTAAQLIAEYGTLDNLLARAGEVKGKRGENLRAATGQLALSRELVTLRHDAPVEFELESARREHIRLEALVPILKELGFNRYQDDVRSLMVMATTNAAGSVSSSSTEKSAPPDAGSGTTPRSRSRPNEPDPFEGGLFSRNGPDRESGEAVAPGPRRAQSGEYRCIRTRSELDELLAEMRASPIFAIDTETTSLSPHRAKLCGISISTRPGTGAYIPVRSPNPSEHLDERTVLEAIRPLLEDPGKPRCGHNLKYDLLIFRRHGVKLDGFLRPRTSGRGLIEAPDSPLARVGTNLPIEPATAFDSMVASYLVDADRSSHSLDSLALALLGRTNIAIKELIGSGGSQRTFDQVPLDLATQYAAEDADVSLQLYQVMVPQLRAMSLMPLFEMVEMPLVEVLAELEWNGITVDPGELDRQRARLQKRIDELRRQIADEAFQAIGREFNPDSPKQLATVLFNKPTDPEPGLGIRPIKRLKTGYSTDSEVLEKLTQDAAVTTPIPQLILEHRELTKLVGTYLVALKDAIEPSTGRIHSSFNQTVAATGRLASSDPNLQNIPIRTEIGREIRRAFVAAPGCVLVSADYSQIELRLLAHLSRDPALIEAFRSGEDIHLAVAAQVHGVALNEVTREQRSGAKMVNFGIIYGVTAFGLARRLGCSNSQAEEIIRGYKKRFAGITTFLQECIDHARRYGYVKTLLGRRRPINEIESNNPSRRAFAERIAINSVVQGSAADLIKLAMIDLQAKIAAGDQGGPGGTERTKMLLQIHDELVFECLHEQADAVRAMVVERMEHAMTLDVPLKVDSSIAQNWFDGK
ncbi:MAG: DNA polymerase I [Phycisphaerales bacterium]|nr:DNA polymerase I [Phycisphaerales bacterium]